MEFTGVTPPNAVPHAGRTATGTAIPSAADFVQSTNVLLGVVTELKETVKDGFERIDLKLEGVCEDVAEIKTARAVDVAVATSTAEAAALLAKQRAATAEAHVLSFRWRVTIAVAAGGALFGALLGFLNFLVGH